MSDVNTQVKKPSWDPADVHATKLPPLFSLRWTSRSLSIPILIHLLHDPLAFH